MIRSRTEMGDGRARGATTAWSRECPAPHRSRGRRGAHRVDGVVWRGTARRSRPAGGASSNGCARATDPATGARDHRGDRVLPLLEQRAFLLAREPGAPFVLATPRSQDSVSRTVSISGQDARPLSKRAADVRRRMPTWVAGASGIRTAAPPTPRRPGRPERFDRPRPRRASLRAGVAAGLGTVAIVSGGSGPVALNTRTGSTLGEADHPRGEIAGIDELHRTPGPGRRGQSPRGDACDAKESGPCSRAARRSVRTRDHGTRTRAGPPRSHSVLSGPYSSKRLASSWARWDRWFRSAATPLGVSVDTAASSFIPISSEPGVRRCSRRTCSDRPCRRGARRCAAPTCGR